MASRKDKQRILSGGLSLLPPSDKLQDGEALLLENWRVDQQGELRSTRGYTVEAGPLFPSDTFHTLTRAAENRFAGVGTSLLGGPSLGTSVATGLDGNPLGISFYQGKGWVMNRAKQLRLTGLTANKWGIAAPATAPQANTITTEAVQLNEYNDKSLVRYAGYFGQPGEFENYPQTTHVAASIGTVAVIYGPLPALTSDIEGTGTNWDATLIGQSINIQGTKGGESYQIFSVVQTVTDATHMTIIGPMDLDTASGLSYGVATEVDAVQFNVDPTDDPAFGTVPMLVESSFGGGNKPWEFVTELIPGHDSTAAGNAGDGDRFVLNFWAETPSAIDQISITLYSDQDTLGQNAPTVTANLSGALLTQALRSWSTLVVKRAINLDLSGLPKITAFGNTIDPISYPDPDAVAQVVAKFSQPHFLEYLGSEQYTGAGPDWTPTLSGTYPLFSASARQVTGNASGTLFDWSNITGIVITVWPNGACRFGFGEFVMLGDIVGGLTGPITLWVSYANADGEDSNPSPEVDIQLNGQGIQLSNIPVSDDPQVTQRWIYAIGGGLAQPSLVYKISDNASTGPVVLNIDVAAVQASNIVMPTNRTLPPAAKALMGPFLGRLLALGTDEHPARYFWPPVAQPWFYPGADEEDEGNWEDAGADDDALVNATNHKRLAILYKQRSIWLLPGDPDQVDVIQTNAKIGLVGPSALANGGDVDYLVGAEGVYNFNGDYETKLSDAIDPIFKGDAVQLSDGLTLLPINKDAIGTCVLELINDRLYFAYPEQGSSRPTVMAILNIGSGKWSGRRMTANGGACTALHYEGSGSSLMGGSSFAGNTYLLRMENGLTDFGLPIVVKWQSRFTDQGLPDNKKRYSDLVIDFRTAVGSETPSTLTAALVFDNGTVVTLGTFSGAKRGTVEFQVNGGDGQLAKNCAVKISGSSTSTCIIYGVYLHWYPEERQALTFDSGVVGAEKVRQVDMLELELTGTAQAVGYRLQADLPGRLLQDRITSSATAPNGRGMVGPIRFGSVAEGRNLRLVLATSSLMQVHKARIRQRTIGEYIDGTNGEYFESAEFSVAPGRDGELKDVLIDYDASAAGQVVLYADSDPPSNQLAIVRTLTLPAGARRTMTLPFEDSVGVLPYGTIFKVRVLPSAGSIIRLHGRFSIRARLLGISFDGSAGEIWETQPLDLFGGIGLFREIAMVAQTTGGMHFDFATEIPGTSIATRAGYDFNCPGGRQTVYFRMPGSTKGQLQKFKVSGGSACRIFEVRVYGRGLGNVESAWTWVNVPMDATPNDFSTIQVPCGQTQEGFEWVELPVDAIE